MSDQKAQILQFILEQLIVPYRRKEALQREQGSEQLPGSRFGLREVGRITVGRDLLHQQVTYRMDGDLCVMIGVENDAICILDEIAGEAIRLDIPALDHSTVTLDNITLLLTTYISAFLLRA